MTTTQSALITGASAGLGAIHADPDLVDAALAGLDGSEIVTMPSLRDVADWHACKAARLILASGLSGDTPAPRYRVGASVVGA
jgi:uncharacterized protein